MAQDTFQGDRAKEPSSKYLASPEAGETGTIHLLELPETPALAVPKLRAVGGDWFHRAQRESIGVESPTPRRAELLFGGGHEGRRDAPVNPADRNNG
jgi:hypothetical protein